MMKRASRTDRSGLTLVELMATMVIIAVAVVGAMGFRYQAGLQARHARVRLTAARLASALLYGWKGNGGHSGYSWYEVEDPTDYDPSDPNDYDPADIDNVDFNLGLTIEDEEPGPDLPEGFTPLDTDAKPNYSTTIDGVCYYITLGYKDEEYEPRTLYVCVAWMEDHGSWAVGKAFKSISYTTYAED